jgi:threonine/homoserine/homoserine lactone efflux protein
MPSAETSAAFFGIAVLLALAPGPDNLFVLVQSAMSGRRAGLLVVLGLCTGLFVHTAAVALGLAALIAGSPLAFTVLKWIGALYLAWLAWQAFTAPSSAPDASVASGAEGWRLYRRGIVMNVTNPKVTIFFLAFLPQFVSAEASVAQQVIALGLLFMAATLLVFGAIAVFAGSLGGVIRRSAAFRRALNWAAGAVFLGLALRLAAERP